MVIIVKLLKDWIENGLKGSLFEWIKNGRRHLIVVEYYGHIGSRELYLSLLSIVLMWWLWFLVLLSLLWR